MASKKRKKKKSLFVPLILVLILVLISILGLAVWNVFDAQKPLQEQSEEVIFEVSDGDNFRTVCTRLEDEGIIKDGKIAYYYVRWKKLNSIYAGKFKLDKSWDLEKIFAYIGSASNIEQEYVTLTIVEGDWCKDIARKIQNVIGISSDDLIALWSNREWIESQMDSYPFLTEEMFNDDVRIYLEGYLAPDTYHVNPDASAVDVTKMILNHTLDVYQRFAGDIAANELSIHQFYTLASIVQYEAGGSEEDLRTIAGVFLNRLSINMPLQSSVTVCYAIDFDKENDNWQACEFNSDNPSPYNTYQIQGLPPGPIENPGELVLDCVLHPIESDYLFFMADVYGDGTIYYARTYDEHQANVAKYLH